MSRCNPKITTAQSIPPVLDDGEAAPVDQALIAQRLRSVDDRPLRPDDAGHGAARALAAPLKALSMFYGTDNLYAQLCVAGGRTQLGMGHYRASRDQPNPASWLYRPDQV